MKKYLPYIIIGILFVLVLGFGIWGFSMYRSINRLESQISQKEDAIRKEQLHIDSLNNVISAEQSRVAFLQDSVKNIKTKVVVKEVERVKYLPIDSNVVLLKDNIQRHGELTDTLDTLPSVISLNEDTVVAISENNLKDINSVFVKYEWGLVENEILTDIIETDSTIIVQKDSIILSKDVIISKQDSIFDLNMKRMEKEIKKDKIIAGTVGGAVGAATVAVIVLGILLGR